MNFATFKSNKAKLQIDDAEMDKPKKVQEEVKHQLSNQLG